MDTHITIELVRRAAAGDRAAFDGLINGHLGAVERLIFRLAEPRQREDLLQEVFLRAWLDLPSLREPDRFLPWLLQVARNRCRDSCKRGWRHEQAVDATEIERQVNRLGRGSAASQAAAYEVRDAVERMQPQDRRLLQWRYFEGATIAQIAAGLGRPQGTVKRHLHEARTRLRALWDDDERRGRMSTDSRIPFEHPFPTERPPIAVTPCDAEPFSVDCMEMRWWFGRPVVGDCTLWST